MTESIIGTFAAPVGGNIAIPNYVFVDQLPGGPIVHSDYTHGFVRVADLQLRPDLTEDWSLIGWSMRGRVGYLSQQSGAGVASVWARWGAVWAGLTVDQPLSDIDGYVWARVGVSDVFFQMAPSGRAQLPADLSTFAKLWEPDDPIRQIVADPGLDTWPANGTADLAPVGLVTMFPMPIAVRAGMALQMALIAMPSLVPSRQPSGADLNIALLIGEIVYTVFYERQERGRR